MSKEIKISVIHARSYDPPLANDYESALAYVNINIEKTLTYITEAGKASMDLVCTHEDFTNVCAYCRDYTNPELFNSLAKAIKEPLQKRLSNLSKQYSMLIAANHMEWDDGHVYNTSTLYGRDGTPLGKYRKVHLADSENWKVTPGDEFNIIESDIGKIGFCICYDMIFPETCRILTLNGADIIIHQTQGWGTGSKASPVVGEGYMRVRAAENSVYLIVAKNIQSDGSDGGRSVIINPYGDILAESDVTIEGLLNYTLTPEFDMISPYNFNNFYSGVPSSKARQLLARKPRLYDAITNPEPAVKFEYKNYKLSYTFEEGRDKMNEWDDLPDDEKGKFFW